MAFLCLALNLRKTRKARCICISVALFARLVWVDHSGPSQSIVMATFTRMDTLLCGALGALIFRQAHVLDRLRKWLPWIASTAVVTFLAGASLMRSKDGPWGILLFAKTFGFGVLAVGFAALVLHAAATDGKITLFQRLFRSDLLTEFGKYSYGIYVYHVPMLWFCDFFILVSRISPF
jgi:peptidoglycan/LPS O-acetylase OafA/YrhL